MKLIQSLIVTVITFLTISYGPLEAETKKGGFKITRPEKPSGGIIDLTGDKRETIAFQEKDSEEYLFKVIQDIAADSEGNLYILGFRRILQYDRDGRYVKKIAGVGEGPGEYNYPRQLYVASNDHLYVMDMRKMFHYDEKGVFINHILIDSSPHGCFFVPDDKWAFGVGRRFAENGIVKSICKINLETGKTTHLFSVSDPETKFKRTKKGTGGVMYGRKHPYSSKLLLAPINNQGFCFAGNFEGEIRLADFAGNILCTIILGIKPQVVDSKDIDAFIKKYGEKAVERMNLPPVRPIIENLLTDPSGRIYVVLKKSYADKEPVQIVDVFSPKGKYLCRIKLEMVPYVITKNYIYSVAKSEADEYRVKRLTLPGKNRKNVHGAIKGSKVFKIQNILRLCLILFKSFFFF
jgi:hypothetical protein